MLTDNELKMDIYGNSGPLRGCDKCQQVAKDIHDKVMGYDFKTLVCLQNHVMEYFENYLEPCIQSTIVNGSDFKIPSFPDRWMM